MRKYALTTLALCAPLFAIQAAPALGQGETFPTTVSITIQHKPNQDVFRGVVDSPNPNCRENRRVRLFRRAAGPDVLLDNDRSEDNGKWAIDVEGGAPAGDYYVKVSAREIAAGTCLKARSEAITVE